MSAERWLVTNNNLPLRQVASSHSSLYTASITSNDEKNKEVVSHLSYTMMNIIAVVLGTEASLFTWLVTAAPATKQLNSLTNSIN